MEYLRQGTAEAQQQALGELRQFVAHTKMCIQMTKTASCSSKLVLSRHVACSIMKNVQLVADCIRHDYASLAENAYPEAYGAFKHSMLLLIFDEELQVSPVKDDWSLETRSELAAMLCRTLRQVAGDCCFCLQDLCTLAASHNVF